MYNVNLATYRQFTNAAWDWIIQKKKKKKRKDIKIALSLGYPNSFSYNERCNIALMAIQLTPDNSNPR